MNKDGAPEEKQRYHVMYNDPVMNQYVLDAYASAPDYLLYTLSPKDRSLIQKISNTTLEQKLYLLGKLGKRFAFVVADRGKLSKNPTSLITFINWCKRKFTSLQGTTLKDFGLFVRGDKELIQHLSRLSIDITPKNMYLLRDYEEIAVGIERVSDIKLKMAVEEQSTEVMDRWLTKVYRHFHTLPAGYQKTYTVTQQNIPFLFYMHIHRDRLVPAVELAIEFNRAKQTVLMNMEQLREVGICQEEALIVPETEGSYYRAFQLTGYGVTIVNRIREQIVSQ